MATTDGEDTTMEVVIDESGKDHNHHLGIKNINEKIEIKII